MSHKRGLALVDEHASVGDAPPAKKAKSKNGQVFHSNGTHNANCPTTNRNSVHKTDDPNYNPYMKRLNARGDYLPEIYSSPPVVDIGLDCAVIPLQHQH